MQVHWQGHGKGGPVSAQKPIERTFPISEVNRIAERKVMGESDMSLHDRTNDKLVVRMSLETRRLSMPK